MADTNAMIGSLEDTSRSVRQRRHCSVIKENSAWRKQRNLPVIKAGSFRSVQREVKCSDSRNEGLSLVELYTLSQISVQIEQQQKNELSPLSLILLNF